VQQFSNQNKKIKVLTSHDEWFGLTYSTNADLVACKINKLIRAGNFSSLPAA